MNKVPLSKIIPDKDQPRKYFAPEKMASLRDSIKRHGIVNPIIVEKKDDKFLIVDGERRFRAAKDLKLTEIPIVVITSKDPIDRLIEQFHVQEQHEAWTPAEKAQVFIDLCEKMDKPVKEVCQLLSVTKATADMYVAFAQLKFKNEFVDARISLPHAESIRSVKNFTKKIMETELDIPFTGSDEKRLEKALINNLISGDIGQDYSQKSYTKIKDTFRSDPKMIEKFMSGKIGVSEMFVGSKAKEAQALRNLVNNCGWITGNCNILYESKTIKITAEEINTLKMCKRYLEKLLNHIGTE